MAIQKYPIGLQDFGGIRSNGFVYVDKTPFVHQLITSQKYYFLSRPRRFGKSLFISTLECVFKGQKELFEGLYIYDKWAFEEYPVIRISFSNIGYRTKGLLKAIADELVQISEQYDIVLKSQKEDIANSFDELIKSLYKKYNKQVVVLIDEYDKPIIDYLEKENIHKAMENRNVMKTFYSILKDADPYLKLVFITGVSKFSQVSIFSDLNNLNDITMSPDYNTICGISQIELEDNFSVEMLTYDKQKIKEWYNGYRWDYAGDTLYNPFSLLKFFSDHGRFNNYWFAPETSYHQYWNEMANVNYTSADEFISLIRHEYIESKLMAEGIIFKRFDTNTHSIYGAHDLSAVDDYVFPNHFSQYSPIMLRTPPPLVNDNFSNIDDVVNFIKTIEGY